MNRIILLFAICFTTVSCDYFSSYFSRSDDVQISNEKSLKKEHIIIDVRELREIRSGIISKAEWLPTSALKSGSARAKVFMERLEEKKDKKILVYCASGYRSSNFKDYLIERGFDVANLGGYSDAVKKGFEYETPSLSDDDLNCTKRCIKR